MVHDCQPIIPYLPDDEMDIGKYPDRTFFWGILFTKIPIWAHEYHKRVMKTRMAQDVANVNQAKVI